MTSSKVFARNLKEKLCAHYGGRMPSFSTVARDFALRSPHLKHVSSETIRKWIRGVALPTVTRLQVLNEWFQCDLMLEIKSVSDQKNGKSREVIDGEHFLLKVPDLIPLLILKLNKQDQNLICQMIQDMTTETSSVVHSSNGLDYSVIDSNSSEHLRLKNIDPFTKSNNNNAREC